MANNDPGRPYNRTQMMRSILNFGDKYYGESYGDKIKKKINSKPAVNITNRPAKAVASAATTSKKGMSDISGIVPYVSNIANFLRKPPAPASPSMISAASVVAPSLANERNDIERAVRGADMAAEKGLDSNTAAAVRAGNLIQGLQAKSRSYATEAKLGLDARNATAQLNTNVEALNTRATNQHKEDQTSMRIAQQREQSANISNAADKYVMDVARKDQMALEEKKFGIMSKLYGSGVLDRLVKNVQKKSGDLTDDDYAEVLGVKRMNGGKLRYADGGPVNPTAAFWSRMQQLKPVPTYNIRPGSGMYPQGDTSSYNSDFNGVITNDPNTLISQAKIKKYGVNPALSLPAYVFGKNKEAAFNDAAAAKAETAYNIYGAMPRSMKRAFGGPIDEPKVVPVYKTQAEVDNANIFAKSFAKRRGLISGENTYVATKPGDPVVPFTGTGGSPLPEAKKAFTIPSYVDRMDIQSSGNNYWYEDTRTGRIVDIDPSVLNTNPRLRVAQPQVAADLSSRQVATTRQDGGYIGGQITGFPRMNRSRKLRKVIN